MYIPSRFNFLEDSLLDDCKKSPIMNTDIIEKKDGYELQIDLPGVKKEDIQIEMDKKINSENKQSPIIAGNPKKVTSKIVTKLNAIVIFKGNIITL